MPIYLWIDELSQLEVEVLRSHGEYGNSPQGDELPEGEDREKPRKWKRLISGGQTTQKGPTWGPGKGYW